MRYVYHWVVTLLTILVLSACNTRFLTVYPSVETDPVASSDDAADDPCIFIHFNDPSKHAIIGTNKQKGLVVYDLQGKTLHSYDFGLLNNVDIRQDVRWNGDQITIVGASNRTDNSIVFFRLDEKTLELKPLHRKLFSSAVDEVYGFCMYASKNGLFAFVVGKDGVVEQWRLSPTAAGQLTALKLRSFDVGGQCEGMVADDELGVLYVGEEEKGIWKFGANPDDAIKGVPVQMIAENKALKADIEGLTIYYQPNQEGYLIASSQGNNSYAVYTRADNNQYLGSFQIKSGPTIDGTSDTDGIDVSAARFGKQFPKGIFIAQDGKNNGANQNFKIVDWQGIEKQLAKDPLPKN